MRITFFVFFTLLVFHSFAQSSDTASGKKLDTVGFTEVTSNVTDASDADQPIGSTTGLSEYNPLSSLTFYLSILVLLFGLIVMGLEVYLIATGKIIPDHSIKFITVTLIVTSTLFLITAGYSNNQIAPATGLLGTIAGYLLGRGNNGQQEKIDKEKSV